MDLISFLQNSPAAGMAVAGVIGLLVGSFLNVVILRLPVMMERQWRAQCREMLDSGEQADQEEKAQPFNLLTPASHCPQCRHRLSPLENIPILSYLVLRGKCKHCAAAIPLRYPVTEALTALLSVAVAWRFGFTWECLAALALTWSLIALSIIDFDHQLLPDAITLPLLWLGLLLNVQGLFVPLEDAVIGAAAGYLSLWIIFQGFRLLTGKEGMGYGDFKLLAALGAWLGWQYLLLIVLLSSVVGAVIGVALIVARGRDRSIPMPFGPYLAIAGWIALLWGEKITATYLTWMGI